MVGSPETFDLCVVGAGILGLATARALLAKSGRSLVVLEAEDRPAAHQSGHNSGVIHSGLYYRPGSDKARLCAAGREAMYAYCAEKGIPHERCGKVVVATCPEEVARLDELERRGRANGLTGIERLGPQGLAAHEPEVAGVEGLFVEETGIADFAQVAAALADDVRAAGGEVRLSCAAGAMGREAIPGGPGGFRIATPRGELRARGLVNCGGLQADRVARRAGHAPGLRIVPFRGEYRQLRPERAGLVRNLIYPVPDPRFPFLGVHLSRRIGGGIEAGPNAVLALHRHGYARWRTSPADLWDLASYPAFWRMAARHWRTGLGELARSLSRRAFAHALARLVPAIRPWDLGPGGAGVRAQALDPDGTLADDFRIARGESAFHVLSAPSPAATASLAIGAEIAERASAHLGL